MSFINLLIEKPRILFLTLSFILLAGISSAISIPIQENPELAQRWSGVRVFYPGAHQRIETQIVNELEIKLREVEEIKELDSIISQGYASITVELEHSIHPDLIEQTWSMVQDKLAQFISPEGVEVVLDRSSGPPITVQYAISWNGSGEAPIVMMSRLGISLKKTKLNWCYSCNCNLWRNRREIVVEVDSNKISSLGLTYSQNFKCS